MSQNYLNNPNVQAWLAVIRFAEGTAKGKNPWGVAFTGASFNNMLPHPQIVRGSPGGYRSDAHGAYQFLSKTWKWIHGGKNPPMTRENQDKAAIKLIKMRGVDPTKPISPALLNKLAPEWASLPTLKGVSYYGQPVKKFDELKKVWEKELQKFQQQKQPPRQYIEGLQLKQTEPQPSRPGILDQLKIPTIKMPWQSQAPSEAFKVASKDGTMNIAGQEVVIPPLKQG